MTDNPMMAAIYEQMRRCESILAEKFKDYGNHEDPFWHFNRAAELLEQTPQQVLMTLFSKHLTCIVEMAKDPHASSSARWEEKITDAINYLLILSAMVGESLISVPKQNETRWIGEEDAEAGFKA